MRRARWLRAVLLASLVSSAVAGCIASQEAGRSFPAAKRRQLVVNRTTKSEAVKLLGPAFTTAAEPDGRERLIYEHTRVSARRLNPFGRSVTLRQTPYEQLVLTFAGGVLADCSYRAESYRAEGETLVPADRVEDSCGGR